MKPCYTLLFGIMVENIIPHEPTSTSCKKVENEEWKDDDDTFLESFNKW